MKRHRVSSELHKRVLQHFQYVWNRSKGVDESAVLGSLPASLRGDIVLFMNRGFITKVGWFKNCTRGFIRSLATRLEQHLFLPKETIFQSGSMGQHMFFINEGIIRIELEDGHHVILKSGEFFGHQSIIEGAPRTYTAVASSVCELLSLSMHKFNELLEYQPELPQMLDDEDAISHFRESMYSADGNNEISSPRSSGDESNISDIEIRIQGCGHSVSGTPKFKQFLQKHQQRKMSHGRGSILRRRSLDSRRASYTAIPSQSSGLNGIRRRNSDITIGLPVELPRRRHSSISVPSCGSNTFRQRSASDLSGFVSPSKVQMTTRRCSISGFHELDPRRDSTMSMQASLDQINTVRRKLGAQSKMGQSSEADANHIHKE